MTMVILIGNAAAAYSMRQYINQLCVLGRLCAAQGIHTVMWLRPTDIGDSNMHVQHNEMCSVKPTGFETSP